ncbi:TetR/AcrR family transcriptional regulator [Sapientia aquatica]|uniref:TetR/AcrR family transcriptional regulator n=1 Tax=Sapientia aquatica TaxID=1549640 RepID=A0A4R5VNA4_9BURK|nr:TetR family transcriptional regulator [Sapientia aquatica]TDK59648.1 TetR/AcrR family transcriptional regulator [Sapientia aquatica]
MAQSRIVEKRAQLKEQIIRGAIEALIETGLASVTTRKIAEKADVNLATLHYYFDNKDALLIGALEMIIAEMSHALSADVTQQRDINTCIENVISNSWKLILKTREIQILQYELTLYTIRNPKTLSLAKFQYDSYCKLYENAFQHVLTKKKLPSNIDIADLVRFVVAGMDGIILQHLVGTDEAISNNSIKHLIKAAQALVAGK